MEEGIDLEELEKLQFYKNKLKDSISLEFFQKNKFYLNHNYEIIESINKKKLGLYSNFQNISPFPSSKIIVIQSLPIIKLDYFYSSPTNLNVRNCKRINLKEVKYPSFENEVLEETFRRFYEKYSQKTLLLETLFPEIHKNFSKLYFDLYFQLSKRKFDQITKEELEDTTFFCRRCYIYCCTTHMKDDGGLYLNKPHNRILKKQTREISVCGKSCFRFYKDFEPGSDFSSTFTQMENNLLEKLFFMYRREYCTIAKLINRKCFQVYFQIHYIEANAPPQNTIEDLEKKRMKIIHHGDNSQEELGELHPCSNHEGSCLQNALCLCSVVGKLCEKWCSCSEECTVKFSGCKCKKKCGTSNCLCKSYLRSCDPDVCQNDPPDCPLSTNKIEKGKSIIIGMSKHGFGAFLREPVLKGEFICEYTGELISDFESNTRGKEFYDKIHLSYLFSADKNLVIDAFYCGNKARFINHGVENCYSKVEQIQGMTRIKIYASRDINEGEELFMDYGETFLSFQTLIE